MSYPARKTYTRRIVPGVTGLAMGGAVLFASPAQAMETIDSTPCTAKMISAHEGATADTDGDTVESQIAAWNVGANLADSDIWKTKDNAFVQRHDNDLSTSTRAPYGTLITNLTLAEVQSYTTRQHGEQIPEVADSLALTQFSEPNRWLMFETKWSMNGTWALQRLDDQIKAAGMSSHVVIYSAYLSQLQFLSTIDPDLYLWYKAGNPPPVADLAGLDGVMLSSSVITKGIVATYHAAGYTVTRGRVGFETQRVWDNFVRKGADAMMTSDPIPVIDRCRALPPPT